MALAASIITGIILAGIGIALVLIGWACLVAAALADRAPTSAGASPPPARP